MSQINYSKGYKETGCFHFQKVFPGEFIESMLVEELQKVEEEKTKREDEERSIEVARELTNENTDDGSESTKIMAIKGGQGENEKIGLIPESLPGINLVEGS